jgi:hypothetical protein
MKDCFIKIVLTCIFLILLLNSTQAQNVLLQSIPEDKLQFGLRYLRPNFDWYNDLSAFSGIYDLSVNIPFSSRINLVSSISFTTLATEYGDSENGIGNVYIGLQSRGKAASGKQSIKSLGVFLPTLSEDNPSFYNFGIFGNYIELHKYAPDLLTLYGNFSYFNTPSKGIQFGIEIGPVLWIPTENNGREPELLAHYGFMGGFQFRDFAIFAELAGLGIIIDYVDEFGDRLSHSLAFSMKWTGSNVKPVIFYKIYLDEDLSNLVDGVFGIKLEASFK